MLGRQHAHVLVVVRTSVGLNELDERVLVAPSVYQYTVYRYNSPCLRGDAALDATAALVAEHGLASVTAAATLPTKAAVRRLVAVTLTGLQP